MRKLRIATLCYGDRFIDLFHRCLMRSLLQPGNLPAFAAEGREIEHLIVTQEADRERFEDAPALPHYTRRVVVAGDGDTRGKRLFEIILPPCLEDGALLLMACADCFFADGAVSNTVTYNVDRHLCLAGCDLRVRESLLDALPEQPIPPGKLVRLAFEHAHSSIRSCFLENDCNDTHLGSGRFQRVTPNLYSVIFRNAQIKLASIDEKDVEYFATAAPFWPDSPPGVWANWDWSWAQHVLIPAGRYKFLASSDLMLCVEPTPEYTQREPQGGMQWNDEYYLDHTGHFQAQRCAVGLLRAE